jgi:hypothetical protein
MPETLPAGLITFPGSGIFANLADKARKLGIPVAVRRRACAGSGESRGGHRLRHPSFNSQWLTTHQRFAAGEVSEAIETDPSRLSDVIHTKLTECPRLAQIGMREQCTNGGKRSRRPPDRPSESEPIAAAVPANHRELDPISRDHRRADQCRKSDDR